MRWAGRAGGPRPVARRALARHSGPYGWALRPAAGGFASRPFPRRWAGLRVNGRRGGPSASCSRPCGAGSAARAESGALPLGPAVNFSAARHGRAAAPTSGLMGGGWGGRT